MIVLLLSGCSDGVICADDLPGLEGQLSIIKNKYVSAKMQLNHDDCGYIYNILLKPRNYRIKEVCEKALRDFKLTSGEYKTLSEGINDSSSSAICDFTGGGKISDRKFVQFKLDVSLVRLDMARSAQKHTQKQIDQFRLSNDR